MSHELDTQLQAGSIDVSDHPADEDVVEFSDGSTTVEDYDLASELVRRYGWVTWADGDPGPDEDEEMEKDEEDDELDLPDDPDELDACPFCDGYVGDNVGQHAGQVHPEEWNEHYGE